MKSDIVNLVVLVRPHQYVKNLFIFLPLFFVGKIGDVGLLVNACIAFVAFSLTASAIYILNDYKDIESDQSHPKKRHRPLASGTVSIRHALILMVLLLSVGLLIMAGVSMQSLGLLSIYLALNIAYTFYLKHVAILDVSTIAVGFVIRILVGSTATGVPLSMWIVIMTFLLALFMALAKRRDDMIIYLDTGEKTRKVIDGYNIQLIDSAMMIMASVVIVSYILYTTSADVLQRVQTENLYITALFVILGVMRYLQISFVENNGGSPTRIVLKDRFMQVTILSWLSSFGWILYV